MAKTPQFGAKFAPGVKYLRHSNGIVYPYMAALAADPNYTVVQFSRPVEIQARPLGFTPPEREVEPEAEKKEVEKISDLAGAMNQELLNPPLPEAAKVPAKAPEMTAAQLLSGLEGIAGE